MSSRFTRAAVVFMLALGAACAAKPAPPPPAGGGKTVDAATAGSISGKVIFTGARPPVDVVRMGIDTVCAQGAGANVQSQAVLIAADGALANAFVYLKSGVDPAYSFAIPVTPVTLAQKGCRYLPRVFGVRAGQPIDVVNDDATLHNVHAMPMLNQEFNQGEPTQGMRLTTTFTVPEVMVLFKCNVHPWMSAYAGVVANPFFAVTGADGTFTINGIPPGTYTVEAWHEKFGTQTAKVTIGNHEAATTTFTFASH